jgi:hypothetical protein
MIVTMIDIQDKKIYFAGKGDLVDYVELEKFLLQHNVKFVPTLNEANLIIEGGLTPLHIQDKIFTATLNGIVKIDIQEFEQFYSKKFNINSTLMAIKLSKDKQRLVNLLQNKYFPDDTFIKILKQYDFQDIPLYDTDESRDVCRAIVNRFCTLVKRNHNIQYAPIGIYYTALETFNTDLLDIIYNMPHYSISSRTAKPNQPLSLKEVVALNPNSSKTIQIQILINQDKSQLQYLSSNSNIDNDIKIKLKQLDDIPLQIYLLKNQNFIFDSFEEIFANNSLKVAFLEYYIFDKNLFDTLLKFTLEQIDIVYLCKNRFLTTYMIDILEQQKGQDGIVYLLKHPNISTKLIDKYLKHNDKICNIAIAHNTKLSQNQYKALYDRDDLDVNISLASNENINQKLLEELYGIKDRFIDKTLCLNINCPLNILMQLQLDNELKLLVKENITYQKFAEKMLGFSG